QSEEEFQEHSQQLFRRSQSEAVVAALRQLGYPTKVVVGGVVPDTPAAEKPSDTFTAGDRIVAVEGTKVDTAKEVQRALRGSEPGDTVSITLSDADASEGSREPAKSEQRRVEITLGERPNSERA